MTDPSISMTIAAFDPTGRDHRDVTVRLANEAEGNVYIYIDGVEYGSLFFHRSGEQVVVTLGQYDATTEQWEDRNDLLPVKNPAL